MQICVRQMIVRIWRMRDSARVMVTFDADYIKLHGLQLEYAGIAYLRPKLKLKWNQQFLLVSNFELNK